MMENSKKTKNIDSRRSFIKKASLSAGIVSSMSLPSFADIPDTTDNLNSKGDLDLKIAGYEVNRIKAIVSGKIKIKGFNYSFEKGSIGDLNTNIFSGAQSYDITEIGLHPFMLAHANDGFQDYTLLPIFPVRIFRHKSVFIRNDRGITKPEDLKGKTIGTAGYSSTSLTWLRGIFQDEYNIKPEDVTWVVSNKDSSADTAGKISKQEKVNPKGITIKQGSKGKDESDLLVSGEVDALFHAAEPKAYIEGNPLVERLFPDSKRTEQAYYKKHGIFPIMHAIAVKKTLIDQNPEVVKAIFDAYSESKKLDYLYMKKLGWVFDSLPWYGQELESTKNLMGDNFWPYGIEANRKALETLFRYSYEQGLSKKHLTIESLFHSTSLALTET
ncbi:MAG: ABC transporter substrate-binding protein [Reichenbachiella sp.]